MATKVTAAQRKHAAQSLLSMYTTKGDAIRNEFVGKAENKPRVIPPPVTPSTGEAMRAVLGMESRAELLVPKEDILRSADSSRGFYSFNPIQWVKPLNHVEIDAVKSHNEVIAQRHREQVDGRLVLLRSAYTSACDVAALSDNGDALLQVVQEFERREF
jgi:hypothetical protein